MRPTLALSAALLSMAAGVAQQPQTPPRPQERAGAAQRNENVQVSLLDNDAVKESLIRLGAAITAVDSATPARNYFGTEYGKAASPVLYLAKRTTPRWTATFFEEHRNSVFNARTFFQVGPVQPSRSNVYGISAGGPLGLLGKDTWLFLDISNRQVRGMVNGNALVPLASERTPLATDPATRALVEQLIAAYRPGLPNRPDHDQRARNGNAPQVIDNDREEIRLERGWGPGRVTARYQRSAEIIDAFQFVAGQNPDQNLRSHHARLSWERPLGAGVLSAAAGFSRVHSLLPLEPEGFPSRVRIGHQVTDIGAYPEYPIDRAENTFRWGAQLVLPRGAHRWTLGTEWARFQINGRESYNSAGYFLFSNNFGRGAIDNFRFGTPSSYEVTLGQMSRGFRNLEANFFLGDTWKVSPALQLNLGARYNLRTAPVEINGRTAIPFDCDCNNVSPIFGFAWRAGGNGRYGVVRGHYSISFGEIFGVTYQQARFNPPEGLNVQVSNPSLVNPLAGIDLSRTGLILLSPDLASPYAHQYHLTWQRQFAAAWTLQWGYIGSRTIKVLQPFTTNRAHPVAGVALTTATVNLRRADAAHYDVIRIGNSSTAALDAAQVRVDLPRKAGLMISAGYTLAKSIDSGSSYIGTAAHGDLSRARAQSEYDSNQDKRGVSDFDTPHTLLIQSSYLLPVRPAGPVIGRLLGGWEVSGATLFRSGAPFTLYIGSDAPGFGNVDGGAGDRPNVVDPRVLGRVVNHPDLSAALLPRTAFDFVRPGQERGNLGRGTFRKDGISNMNLAISRTFRLAPANGHNRTLYFRAEAYNLTNHPQFAEPQRNLSAPDFGKISNTLNDGRILQFTLRLTL